MPWRWSGNCRADKPPVTRCRANAWVAALIATTAARRSPGQTRAAAARFASPTRCVGPLRWRCRPAAREPLRRDGGRSAQGEGEVADQGVRRGGALVGEEDLPRRRGRLAVLLGGPPRQGVVGGQQGGPGHVLHGYPDVGLVVGSL